LTKATDRFPSTFQVDLLIQLYPFLKDFEKELEELIFKPDVTYLDSNGQKQITTYAVGSPMGIYTS
jgi:hypothetical protein